MKKIFTIILIIIPLSIFAQLTDDFESGNLNNWNESTEGHWSASTQNSINGNYSLKHVYNNADAGNDIITAPFGVFDISAQTTTWQFQIRYEYEPSSSNKWYIALFSDTDISVTGITSSTGYYLCVNLNSLTDDLLKLYKFNAETETLILNTNYNWQTSIIKTGTAGIQINRTQSGTWSVYVDDDGGFDNLIQIGTSVTDAAYTAANYFGIYHEYTSTADQMLWIDDIYVGNEITDTQAPYIKSGSTEANNTIELYFNELLNEASAENTANYSVNNSIGNPVSATLNLTDYRTLTLVFANTFTDGILNTLTVNNVEDTHANVCSNLTFDFSYTHIAPVSAVAVSQNKVDVFFNKDVENISAQNILNYTADNGLGNPTSAVLDAADNKIVHLTFASDFVSETQYLLNISNIKDLAGNTIIPTSLDFLYYIPKVFDIVFNEIMCDISSIPVSLPNKIYIELYNRSDYDINLSGWIFVSEGQSDKNFPDITLASGQYLILCQSSYSSLFEPYGNVAAIISSTDLTVTGRKLRLINPQGIIIDEVEYSNTWYDNDEKENGGWSLEKIDTENTCGTDNNWTASAHISGGTPGTINSANAPNPDTSLPQLETFELISSNTINLSFTKNISYQSSAIATNYYVNNSVGNPESGLIDTTNTKNISLHFANQFTDQTEYILYVENISDNCGNIIEPVSVVFTYKALSIKEIWIKQGNVIKAEYSEIPEQISATNISNYIVDKGVGNPVFAVSDNSNPKIIYIQFADTFPINTTLRLTVKNISDVNGNIMPETVTEFYYAVPQVNDIVINEVLFNPYIGGSDFVEIINCSDYTFNLSELQFANRNDSNQISDITLITETDMNIKSGEYYAFTPDKENVLFNYINANDTNITETSELPSFPDDKGTVILLYNSNNIIDEFSYDESMHYPLLISTEGVSLEKINYESENNDANNWHSASEDVGFASPGNKNSQFVDIMSSEVNQITVQPEIFSPNNDGYDDYANIAYNFSEPGYTANIYILDSFGSKIKHLANNILLGSEGHISWDGTNSENMLCKQGIYIVYFEIFNTAGIVKHYKKVCTLAVKN